MFLDLCLQELHLGLAFLTLDGPEGINIPIDLQGHIVGPGRTTATKGSDSARRRKIHRREKRLLGGSQRSLALLYRETHRIDVGISHQRRVDEPLQQRIGKELTPRYLGQQSGVGGHFDITAENVGRNRRLGLVFAV